MTFVSVNMKCYWTVNSSYWPPLHVSQYEVNTSWPPQQKSIVLQYWKPKINSFSYAEKKFMAYVHQLLDQPSQWQTSQQAGPCSVPKFTSTSITVKQLLIKNKNFNQSKSSLLIWHYVSYLFLFTFIILLARLFEVQGELLQSPRLCASASKFTSAFPSHCDKVLYSSLMFIRKHSYLDHWYPGGLAFIPCLLTPELMPRVGLEVKN